MPETRQYAQKLLQATKAMIAAVEKPASKSAWGISVQADNPLEPIRTPHTAWFTDRQEAVDFLLYRCVWVFPAPDPVEQSESASVYAAIAARLIDRLGDEQVELDELNVLTRGLFTATWLGYCRR